MKGWPGGAAMKAFATVAVILIPEDCHTIGQVGQRLKWPQAHEIDIHVNAAVQIQQEEAYRVDTLDVDIVGVIKVENRIEVVANELAIVRVAPQPEGPVGAQ